MPASALTPFSTLHSPSTGSPGPPGEAVEGGGARDDPAWASWRQPSGKVACGPRPPRPHSPVGLPASQMGFRGKPSPLPAGRAWVCCLLSLLPVPASSSWPAAVCPSQLAGGRLWVCDVPTADQAGEGTRVGKGETRGGLHPAPSAAVRAAAWRQGRVDSAPGLQVPRAEAAGPVILPRRLASPGIHLRPETADTCAFTAELGGRCAFYHTAAFGFFLQLPQNIPLQGQAQRG